MLDSDEILRQREKQDRLLKRQRIDDVRLQMGSTGGRRFVWSLLVATRFEVRSTLFDTHGGRQSYLLGAYEVGRNLSEEIRTLCPEQYLLMVQENTPRHEEIQE